MKKVSDHLAKKDHIPVFVPILNPAETGWLVLQYTSQKQFLHPLINICIRFSHSGIFFIFRTSSIAAIVSVLGISMEILKGIRCSLTACFAVMVKK